MRSAAVPERELEVLLADDALRRDLELVAEARRRESPVPTPGRTAGRRVSAVQSSGASAPSVSMTRSRSAGESSACAASSKAARKRSKSASRSVRPAAAAWPPNFRIRPGWQHGHPVERVAQVQAGDRAARAADLAVVAARERDGGPVKAVLDAPGHDADHALVPGGVEQAQRVAVPEILRFDRRERSFLHAGLDLAPLAVQAVEFGWRWPARAPGVVGDEAFDAERHVGEPAGGVQPRAQHETQVARRGARADRDPRP